MEGTCVLVRESKKSRTWNNEKRTKEKRQFFFFFSLKTFIKSRTFVEEKEHKLLFEKKSRTFV